MKHFRIFSLAIFAFAPLGMQAQESALKAGFVSPPQEARPQVWWHWMNGNISKEGIRKDLQWMQRVGIGGVHIFDAGLKTPRVVPERITFMTPAWKDCFKYAVELADSLGLATTVTSAPGWSNTGGPWVSPEDAMKKLVWRETTVQGGSTLKMQLPEPFQISGPFQNIPSSDNPHAQTYYKDVNVLAVPLSPEDLSMEQMGAKITSSDGTFNLRQLTDEDLVKASMLPGDAEKGYKWIQVEFNKPYTIKALSIADGRTWRVWTTNEPPATKFLQASNDGKTFQTICKIPISGAMLQTVNVPSTTAKYFRVCFENQKRPIAVSELCLYTVNKVNRAADKAGFGTPSNVARCPTVSSNKDPQLSEIIDLTDKVDANGQLVWKAPKGRWRIYRFGYSLTGKQNHPASPEATGLEVDKLDADAVGRYLEHLVKIYQEASGNKMGKGGIEYMMFDSYEAGIYTWTPKIKEEFKRRRGYELTPWMPALAGQILESAETTDRFLFDWRKTLSELIQENQYGKAREVLRRHGIKTYMESHESSRPFLADGMDVKKNADIPMGAMWSSIKLMDFKDGTENGKQADIHESASVAHLWGQNLVAAESLTANGRDGIGLAYSLYPSILKRVIDLEFASGLNRVVIHESAHQPVDDKIPGQGLEIYGQWFHRFETWAEQAKPWTDYLARTSYMLSQGQYVADVACYYGEDTNATACFNNALPAVPPTYSYDFVNTTALVDLLSYDGRHFVAPSGMKYKLLMLDKNTTRMTVQALRKLDEMVKKGAPICGERPSVCPSLSDSKDEWNRLVDDIWGKDRKNVYTGMSVGNVLKALGISPDFETDDMDSLRFVHRTMPNAEIYWINNRSFHGRKICATFNVQGLKPMLWRPETGKSEEVNYRATDENTLVELDLIPGDAVFVVFQGEVDHHAIQNLPKTTLSDLKTLGGTWTIYFQKNLGAPEKITTDSLKSYTESSDPGVKYFGGTAVYTNHFKLSKKELKQGRILLDLGTVYYLAGIKVNGKDFGWQWKAPYAVDITDALQAGDNQLEIQVTSLWRNRIIGDQQPDCKQGYTYTSYKFYDAKSPLIPAGLVGPVKLQVRK